MLGHGVNTPWITLSPATTFRAGVASAAPAPLHSPHKSTLQGAARNGRRTAGSPQPACRAAFLSLAGAAPAGVPMKWRDPANYAYTEDLPLWRWAWEFLRRSERYREAWGEYRKALEEERRRDAMYLFTDASIPFDLGWPIEPSITATELDGNPWLTPVGKHLFDNGPLPDETADPFRWTRLTFDSSQPLGPQLSMAEWFLVPRAVNSFPRQRPPGHDGRRRGSSGRT
jgi:hypothetical protein